MNRRAPRQWLNATQEWRPLSTEVAAEEIFPIDVLGGELSDAVRGIQTLSGAPLALCGHSALATLTLGTMVRRNVMLLSGKPRPLTGIFLAIAESGERKSTVDDLTLEGVRAVESHWAQQAKAEERQYETAKAVHDFAVKQAEKAATKTGMTDALFGSLMRIGPEPVRPFSPMILLDEPSPASLVLHFSHGRPFVGVFNDDAGQFIGGYSFTKDNSMTTLGLLNRLWDGREIRRSRVTTGSLFAKDRRCCVHLMMQQVVADRLYQTEAEGIGFLSRALTISPEGTAGTRFINGPPPPLARIHLDAFKAKMMTLLQYDVDHVDPFNGGFNLPCMMLAPDALAALVAFYNQTEGLTGKDGMLRPIMALANKLTEHAGRLAASLTLYYDPHAYTVPLWAVQAGISLALYYGYEALRISGIAGVPVPIRDANELYEWLWKKFGERNPRRFFLAEVYQRNGMRKFKTADKAGASLKILEDHKHVVRLDPGTVLDGAARKDAWDLIPRPNR